MVSTGAFVDLLQCSLDLSLRNVYGKGIYTKRKDIALFSKFSFVYTVEILMQHWIILCVTIIYMHVNTLLHLFYKILMNVWVDLHFDDTLYQISVHVQF